MNLTSGLKQQQYSHGLTFPIFTNLMRSVNLEYFNSFNRSCRGIKKRKIVILARSRNHEQVSLVDVKRDTSLSANLGVRMSGYAPEEHRRFCKGLYVRYTTACFSLNNLLSYHVGNLHF